MQKAEAGRYDDERTRGRHAPDETGVAGVRGRSSGRLPGPQVMVKRAGRRGAGRSGFQVGHVIQDKNIHYLGMQDVVVDPGVAAEVQRTRPALHVVPDRAVFSYRLWRSGLGRGAGCTGTGSRPVALCPYPVLRFALLLLRLQHGGDARLQQDPTLSGNARPRNGAHCTDGRRKPCGAPAALGRRYANLPEHGRHSPPDGNESISPWRPTPKSAARSTRAN
jgi:hypothetical protein